MVQAVILLAYREFGIGAFVTLTSPQVLMRSAGAMEQGWLLAGKISSRPVGTETLISGAVQAWVFGWQVLETPWLGIPFIFSIGLRPGTQL